LDYDDQGQLILERAKKARDPEAVAERAVALATEGQVPVRHGGWVPLAARRVCVHGDAGNGPAIARRVRERLGKAGVDDAPPRACAEPAARAGSPRWLSARRRIATAPTRDWPTRCGTWAGRK